LPGRSPLETPYFKGKNTLLSVAAFFAEVGGELLLLDGDGGGDAADTPRHIPEQGPKSVALGVV